MNWNEWVSGQLAGVRAKNRWREATAFDSASSVSFASNDYLGLSTHPKVRAAVVRAVLHFGAGATASRLVVGTHSCHDELEAAIADWQGTERSLVLPSGYHANLAALMTLGTDDTVIFSDELNHASIIDGCRLSKAEVVVYRHNDLEHLQALMKRYSCRKLVVTDSVFSMDGDVAPLDGLATLCAAHGALLVVDDAHAVLQSPRALPCMVLRVGTLSKALGSQGGWIAGTRTTIELLTNKARAFVFTTGLAPTSTAAALAALNIYRSKEGAALRDTLRGFIDLLAPLHPSPIVPHVLGDEYTALAASAALRAQGMHIPAIRPPTVPPGTSRLRIALSAKHSAEQVLMLRDSLHSLSDHLRLSAASHAPTTTHRSSRHAHGSR